MENHDYEEHLAAVANEMKLVSYRLWALERFVRINYGWQALDRWWEQRDKLTEEILREVNE